MSQVVQVALGHLPPARDFILSAGFAGVAAVVAAVIVLCALLYGSRRAGQRFRTERDENERRHEERREDRLRAEALARCWDRWWQVLQTAALEPAASEGATLGLGPEVALVVLRGLLRDAEQLGDDTLAKAIAVYQEQLLLVLAQQSGPLSRLATTPTAPPNGGQRKSTPPDKQASTTKSAAGNSSSEPGQPPKTEPAAHAATEPVNTETPSAAGAETGRRRR